MKATNTPTSWPAGLLAAALILGVLHLVNEADRKADAQAERAAIVNAEMDATSARMDRAAADLCRAELGPGAQALWTNQGDLVCRPAVMTASAEGGVR